MVCGTPGQPDQPPSPVPPHNTPQCEVNSSGAIISSDQIFAEQDGDPVHSGGGGCINRPIRDVLGVFFDNPVMKPDDVDEYSATPTDASLVDQTQRIFFAFDLYNKKNVPLINPDWTVRWFYALVRGSYTIPNVVSIKFQKVAGTGYIKRMDGGYVLNRVTDTVTSFAMDQYVDASSYNPDKARGDVTRAFERMRTGAPDLPATPQYNVPPN